MLALSRKKGEAIMIEGGIEIRILDLQGDKVRIGIHAPKALGIYREEVYEEIKSSNQAAVHKDLSSIQKLKAVLNEKKEEN